MRHENLILTRTKLILSVYGISLTIAVSGLLRAMFLAQLVEQGSTLGEYWVGYLYVILMIIGWTLSWIVIFDERNSKNPKFKISENIFVCSDRVEKRFYIYTKMRLGYWDLISLEMSIEDVDRKIESYTKEIKRRECKPMRVITTVK